MTKISDQTGLALSPGDVAVLFSQCQSVSSVWPLISQCQSVSSVWPLISWPLISWAATGTVDVGVNSVTEPTQLLVPELRRLIYEA